MWFTDNIVDKITEGTVNGLQKFFGTLFHGIITGIIAQSYWICLTACIIALLLYIAGMKKAGKYVSLSFIIYFILKAVSLII